MATINSFEELRVWQKARIMCQRIYNISQEEKFSRDYKLKDQINRSSGSVMDNIAEGFGRKGNIEFINFLTMANGSLMESKSQAYRAFDRGYIDADVLHELINTMQDISNMLSGLIIYLGRSNLKGTKFKFR